MLTTSLGGGTGSQSPVSKAWESASGVPVSSSSDLATGSWELSARPDKVGAAKTEVKEVLAWKTL